ncbi:hypothetical protein [Microbulbifer sp. JMSA002]|uniref:hypothetical protein n=1 Tax=Microbulbifer sp. JMSA002 TaxID=3243368 RepID=UPI00403A211D
MLGNQAAKEITYWHIALNISFTLWFLAKIAKRKELLSSDISITLSAACALLLLVTVGGLSLKLFRKLPALTISILSILPLINFFVFFYLNYKIRKAKRQLYD